ncbi:hypothetical protein HanIR_Chr04g0157301 [Helianthus annuus]|nr:hypothetical protein HanIR_Chr04g0157301 [Helianthus annuus]
MPISSEKRTSRKVFERSIQPDLTRFHLLPKPDPFQPTHLATSTNTNRKYTCFQQRLKIK